MDKIKILDVVAILEDFPQDGLLRGQVGTIVDRWKDGVFEVEFSDLSGRTAIPGVTLSDKEKFASTELSVLASNDAMKQLQDVLVWAMDEVNNAHHEPPKVLSRPSEP